MGETTGPIERPTSQLEKAPTGIIGLDEISGGGLPHCCCTLVSGAT